MKNAAIALVFRSENEVLLIKRKDLPVWVLPGGGIEENETPEEACQRELFEETGIHGIVSRKLGYAPAINRFIAGAHLFECTMSTDPYQPLYPQEESEEVAFYSIDRLPSPLFFLHKQWIQEARNTPTQPISQLSLFSCIGFLMQHPILSFRYLYKYFALN